MKVRKFPHLDKTHVVQQAQSSHVQRLQLQSWYNGLQPELGKQVVLADGMLKLHT